MPVSLYFQRKVIRLCMHDCISLNNSIWMVDIERPFRKKVFGCRSEPTWTSMGKILLHFMGIRFDDFSNFFLDMSTIWINLQQLKKIKRFRKKWKIMNSESLQFGLTSSNSLTTTAGIFLPKCMNKTVFWCF